MRVDQIEIHAGIPEFDYEVVRQLEAKCEAKTAFSPAPTIQAANFKLQEMAAGIGADAVIGVTYDSGVSMTSWRSMKATGLAVRRVADEIVCPVCAEKIRRAATKCRFCGTELQGVPAPQPAAMAGRPLPPQRQPSRRPANPTPLRATDNSMTPLLIIVGVVVALFVFGALLGS